MTQNTSPVLAGVQTIFAVPRNLWLASSGEWEENTGKLKAVFSAACQCTLHGRGWRRWGAGGVTGNPGFHSRLKSFILRTPKKLVFGSYGSGWFHTRSSLFLECPPLCPSPPIFPFVSPLTHQVSAASFFCVCVFYFFSERGVLSSPQRGEESSAPALMTV